MSYIPSNVVAMSKDNGKIYDLGFPDKGLLLESGISKIGHKDGYCSDMNNVIPKADGIYSVKKGISVPCDTAGFGSFFKATSTPFGERHVLHMGSCLYTLSYDGSVDKIMEGVAEKAGIFCRFSSKLYYYCDGCAYVTDRDFSCTRVLPYAPLMFSVTPTGVASKISELDGGVFNLLCPRITVKYDIQSVGSYRFPLKCDTSREIEVFKADGTTPLGVEIVANEISFNFKNLVTEGPFYVTYFFQRSEDDGYDDLFDGCSVCTDFGAGTVSASRIIVSGNRQRPGEYCFSGVLDPLYFPINTAEKIGDGCDNVTGFLKVHSYLLVFTSGGIYKMVYAVKDGYGEYTSKLINNTVGCDIPGSIALIDNRAVFAGTSGGVYIVCPEDETGENSVKQISGNINKGKDSLLSHCFDELYNGVSADFDGKYILSAGQNQYVWDYGMSGFRNSADYGSCQGRLLWYRLSLGEMRAFFTFSDKIFAMAYDGSIVCFGSEVQEEHLPLPWRFKWVQTDFGRPFEKKYITSIQPYLTLKNGGKVKMSLFADGEKYYETIICTTSDIREQIRLPKKAMYKFSLEFSSDEGCGFMCEGARLKIETP